MTTNNPKYTKTFLEIFDIILTADRETSRKAAREVRKTLYSSTGGRDGYKDMKNITDRAPIEYSKITEDWRRENFVVAVSVLYFLHDKETQPKIYLLGYFICFITKMAILETPHGVCWKMSLVRLLSISVAQITNKVKQKQIDLTLFYPIYLRL